MKLKTSVAGILFPQARHSYKEMEATASYLNGKVDMLEFFYEGEDDAAVGRLLERNNLQGVFIAVIPQKERGLNLCSLDEENRLGAVSLTKECIDRARVTGCHGVMVCSGKFPANPADVSACTDAYYRSMLEVLDYERKSSVDSRIKLLLEPCDSAMDAKHLLGPTSRVVDVSRRILEQCGDGYGLTMDTAHVAEEGEDFMEAMAIAKPYCGHVHFANCVVKDTTDPFYGDKHVDFAYPGSEFQYETLKNLFGKLENLYGEAHLSIALEILCRAENPYQSFDGIMEQMPWFFNKN